MTWEVWLLPVATLMVGALAGYISSERAARKQWERTSQLERERWVREDERRWDKERIDAYTALWNACLDFGGQIRATANEWAAGYRTTVARTKLFEIHHVLALAYARATLLSSGGVRAATLHPLWEHVSQAVTTLSAPYGGADVDAYCQQFSEEFGDHLREFTNKVAGELGIDLSGLDHGAAQERPNSAETEQTPRS